MDDWKHAYRLAKFELKASKWSFIYSLLLFPFILYVSSVFLDAGVEELAGRFRFLFYSYLLIFVYHLAQT